MLEGDPVRIAFTMGAVDPSGGLALGITQPIVEVYVDGAEGGVPTLLPGSGLSMPLGTGWQIAIRVTGDGAWAWHAGTDDVVDLPAPVPVEVVIDGVTLTVLTPFTRPEGEVRLYAISGVYDPFRPDGWRPLSRAPSPWAFSSDRPHPPVVDVFPGDAAARADALARGELPRATRTGVIAPGSLVWVWLMGAGLALAVVGVALRVRAARRAGVAVASREVAEPDVAPARYVTIELPSASTKPDVDVVLIDDAELPSPGDDVSGPAGAVPVQSSRVVAGAFPRAPLARTDATPESGLAPSDASEASRRKRPCRKRPLPTRTNQPDRATPRRRGSRAARPSARSRGR
jgi:hypothetical protein